MSDEKMSASEPLTTHRNGFKTLSKRAGVNDVRRSVGGACLWFTRQPVHRRHDLVAGFDMERGNLTRSVRGEAYKLVKKKGKAAGVDGQSLEDFADDRENNLYRLWNRMASGSYFPPPV